VTKIMFFIDGTWLYSNTARLSEIYGQGDFRVDFGKLPQVLAEELARELGGGTFDVVRTYLFGSYAANCDPRDQEAVQRQRAFFNHLKEEYHYELELFPINFRGRRLRRSDREPGDSFEPKEKSVDIALATSMVYLATQPNAFDVAVAVIGDQDFVPALQLVRRLGKRVAIASIVGSCAPELADPLDAGGVKDFDLIWLDELLHRLELRRERHPLECQSPIHRGDRRVYTTFYPRKGRKFYCPECIAEFGRQRQGLTGGAEETPPGGEPALHVAGTPKTGTVARKIADRAFGFIQASDGLNYFFHLSDLLPGLEFEDVFEGLEVEFEVEREPGFHRAGAAQNVRRRAEEAAEAVE
jgi:uncharacterized LabA/DUF88 family protein/cold shock CspA family protein